MAGPTESPFVVEHDGRWFLLIGPDWDGLLRSKAETGHYDMAAYRRTRVLDERRPDVVRPRRPGRTPSTPTPPRSSSTSDGDWWVSHCGWGQGGVHLARLIWT